MVTISSGFIGSFKLGDNIVHNLDVLRELYATQKAGTPKQQELLRKPIIVAIASIAEAVLFDLYLRINSFTREGVVNIPQAVLDEIRTKTIDEFAKYIDNAKSKSLLGPNPSIYDALTELRKLRNRIHIQNTRSHFEPDEIDAYNATRQSAAEDTLETLLKYMEHAYPRTADKKCVADFVLPW
jgi:hypothetical protein